MLTEGKEKIWLFMVLLRFQEVTPTLLGVGKDFQRLVGLGVLEKIKDSFKPGRGLFLGLKPGNRQDVIENKGRSNLFGDILEKNAGRLPSVFDGQGFESRSSLFHAGQD